MDYLESNFAKVEKFNIDDISCYLIRPKEEKEKYKTIIFYHGWSSNAKNQIFRANIFASYGYQVIVLDAKYHGERGSLDYLESDVVKRYMCQVIMHNIEEFPKVYNYALENLKADEDNIILAGHSMGAITAGGLFTFKNTIKASLIFNGCMDWKFIVDGFTEGESEIPYERMRINDFMLQMNPKRHLEDLKDRILFIQNGDLDDVINPNPQEEFYNELKKEYNDNRRDDLYFEKVEKTYHQLTTAMLESSIKFLKERGI